MNTSRLCPICNQDKHHVIHQFTYVLPSQYGKRDRIEIAACDNCGFVFKNVDKFGNIIEDNTNKNNRYAAFEQDMNRYYLEKEAELIGEMFDCESSILDVGCSTGYLLKCLQMKGYQDLTGLETSEVSCQKARKKGLPIIHGSLLEERNEFKQKFDVIILSHVLEHIIDLEGALQQISIWLKPKGKLYIALPNEENCSQYYGSISSLLCSEHVNHFSIVSLSNLLNKIGYYKEFYLNRPYLAGENEPISYAMSAFDAVFSYEEREKSPNQMDADTERSVKELLMQYDARNLERKMKLEELSKLNNEFIIWGASHMAMNLLPLFQEYIRITAFTDSDESKWGLDIHGIPVVAPKELYNFEGRILVLDTNVKQSICKSIESLSLSNPVII